VLLVGQQVKGADVRDEDRKLHDVHERYAELADPSAFLRSGLQSGRTARRQASERRVPDRHCGKARARSARRRWHRARRATRPASPPPRGHAQLPGGRVLPVRRHSPRDSSASRSSRSDRGPATTPRSGSSVSASACTPVNLGRAADGASRPPRAVSGVLLLGAGGHFGDRRLDLPGGAACLAAVERLEE
jgi:hypothetical protein